jgi:aminopeptidase YwaD
MRLSALLLSLLFLFSAADIQAQGRKKKKKAVPTEAQWWNQFYANLPAQLQKHVYLLASDSLEGRRTGTRGEQMAADYISKRFAETELIPAGDNGGWLQWFEVNEGREFETGSYLIINGKNMAPNTDFFPLNQSGSAQVENLVSPVLQEENMPWFLDLKETLEQNKQNPHYDINAYILQKTTEIVQKKANLLVIFNSSNIKDPLFM